MLTVSYMLLMFTDYFQHSGDVMNVFPMIAHVILIDHCSIMSVVRGGCPFPLLRDDLRENK